MGGRWPGGATLPPLPLARQRHRQAPWQPLRRATAGAGDGPSACSARKACALPTDPQTGCSALGW